MTYGERLQAAITAREAVIGRTITRLELAGVAGCSRQNIGMISNNSKGEDQKLSTKSHAAVCAYLRVSSEWLLTESGKMEPKSTTHAPSELSPAAKEMAVLFDMIPLADRIRRAQAFNDATTAIMKALQGAQPTDQPAPSLGK